MASLAEINEGHGHRGRGRTAGLAAGLVLLLCLVGASAASAAPWGYEQVSPVEKGAGTVSALDTFTAAPDGESILYSAFGSLAEVPSQSIPVYTRYFAERGSNGWSNQASDPPYDLPPEGPVSFAIMATLRSSVNLRYSIVASARALTPGATEGGSNLYMRNNRTGELKLMVTEPTNRLVYLSLTTQGQVNYYWVAPDGKAALFYAGSGTSLEGQPQGVVQWTEEGGVEYVGYYPPEGGVPKTGLFMGTNSGENGTREPLPAVDALTRIYLYSPNPKTPIYLRENGTVTPISVSEVTGEEGQVANGEPVATTEGGRYVFFTILDQGVLTNDAPAGGRMYLYRYDAVRDKIAYVGYSTSSSIPVIQASRDGTSVAFLSPAALTPDAEPAPNKSLNLYVWRNGQLHLVMKTDVGSQLSSGTLASAQANLSPNGRYLYFTDNSASLASKYGAEAVSLACAEPKAPTVAKPCDEAYVYDADANGGAGTLECASCVEGVANGGSGDPSSGNAGAIRYNSHAPRNVNNEGRVLFTTYESFDPSDQNGLEDVYEFHKGQHRLVSTAAEGHSARFVDASEDGKTIFFTTTDAIVPQDKDRVLDLYMTREGAGFPYTPPVETPPCAALESCHGAASSSPNGSNPSTTTFHGQPNPPITVGRVKVTRAAANAKRVRVTVRVSGPGKVTATGPGLRKASKRATKAGKVTLTLRLAPKSEKALNRRGRLNRKVTVNFQPFEGRGASATKALTLKAPGKKGAKHRAKQRTAKHGGGR